MLFDQEIVEHDLEDEEGVVSLATEFLRDNGEEKHWYQPANGKVVFIHCPISNMQSRIIDLVFGQMRRKEATITTNPYGTIIESAFALLFFPSRSGEGIYNYRNVTDIVNYVPAFYKRELAETSEKAQVCAP